MLLHHCRKGTICRTGMRYSECGGGTWSEWLGREGRRLVDKCVLVT